MKTMSEEEMKTRKEKERDRGQISQGVRDRVGAAGCWLLRAVHVDTHCAH